MWIVYLIQHTDTKQLYIGRTGNLERRLKEHNQNQQTATSRKAGKWILIYAEVYRERKDAEVRELRLKDHGRAKQEVYKRAARSFLK